MAFTAQTAKVKLFAVCLGCLCSKVMVLEVNIRSRFLCVIYLKKTTQNLKNQRGNFCPLLSRKRQMYSIDDVCGRRQTANAINYLSFFILFLY